MPPGVAATILLVVGLAGSSQAGSGAVATGPVRGVVALISASAPPDDIYNGQFCGGVLVGRDQVLTAAHCIVARNATTIDAVVGGDNLCRDLPIDGVRMRVADIAIHPSYDAGSGRFDLARLTLQAPLSDDWVRGVELQSLADEPAVAVGWGRASVAGVAPCRLARRPMRLVDEAECASRLKGVDRNFDSTSMICAVPAADHWRDPCSGDSGGPLIVGTDPNEGAVIGIVSWGRGCGDGPPGVYARTGMWP